MKTPQMLVLHHQTSYAFVSESLAFPTLDGLIMKTDSMAHLTFILKDMMLSPIY